MNILFLDIDGVLNNTARHFSSLHDNLVLTDIEYGFTELDLEKACVIIDKQLSAQV